VNAIDALFKSLAPHLRRLTIDMPLRYCYSDQGGGQHLRLGLRKAFLRLECIEEFVSISNEPYLHPLLPVHSKLEPTVWSSWKSLRRLALYNLDVTDVIVDALNGLPELHRLVLTCSTLMGNLPQVAGCHASDPRITIINHNSGHFVEYEHALPLLDQATAAFGVSGTGCIYPPIAPEDSPETPRVYLIDVYGKDGDAHQREHELVFRRFHDDHWAYNHQYLNIQRFDCQSFTKEFALSGELWAFYLDESAHNWTSNHADLDTDTREPKLASAEAVVREDLGPLYDRYGWSQANYRKPFVARSTYASLEIVDGEYVGNTQFASEPWV